MTIAAETLSEAVAIAEVVSLFSGQTQTIGSQKLAMLWAPGAGQTLRFHFQPLVDKFCDNIQKEGLTIIVIIIVTTIVINGDCHCGHYRDQHCDRHCNHHRDLQSRLSERVRLGAPAVKWYTFT